MSLQAFWASVETGADGKFLDINGKFKKAKQPGSSWRNEGFSTSAKHVERSTLFDSET